MTYSDIKTIYTLAAAIEADARELVAAVTEANESNESANTTDYDYLVVAENYIQTAVEDNISSDEYVLGCFNAWFIANVTGWPLFLVEAAQTDEGRAKLGEAIVSEGFVPAMAEAYISADGAGHSLSGYDGTEHELNLSLGCFSVFRN